MVRLKALCPIAELEDVTDFNSTMVRLKADNCDKEVKRIEHFNSTMVRLKVFSLQMCSNPICISIPQWFD